MALRISKTGAVYCDDFLPHEQPGAPDELFSAFSNAEDLPPMDSDYWRRAGRLIAEAMGMTSVFRRAKRKN